MSNRYVAKNSTEKFLKQSKERLEKIAETKLKTSFIGALNQFEIEFGHLWGLNSTQPTPEQQEMRKKWDRVRTSVLNNGNNQIRNLKKELEYYDIKWNRYHVEFKTR